MRIAVFGLGYVGLTTTACLTRQGHEVIGVDVSSDKVRQVNEGRSPILEPGIEDLLRAALKDNRLKCVTAVSTELEQCDIAIVCVGTPSAADGSHNMSFIAEVSRQIATSLRSGRTVPLTVVYRSTIRPGTIDELIQPIFKFVLGDKVDAVELVYNPEFLRESTAIDDYFDPPKIVVGTADGEPCARLEQMNEGITAPTFYTRFRDAEFTKFVDNTFHALKVAFANEIGRVCVQLNIDTRLVHKIFVSDTKLNISPYYLRPGGPFGGSCLPKDVRALQYISGDVGANTPVVDALIRSNEAHKHFLFTYCTQGLKPGAKVLMLGLAFKSDSDDLRESPHIDLARKLLQGGYGLAVYDPFLKPDNLVGQNLGYAVSYLPELPNILVSREHAESEHFDIVIDTNGRGSDLNLRDPIVLDISRLK